MEHILHESEYDSLTTKTAGPQWSVGQLVTDLLVHRDHKQFTYSTHCVRSFNSNLPVVGLQTEHSESCPADDHAVF